jgi:hypothetical protein
MLVDKTAEKTALLRNLDETWNYIYSCSIHNSPFIVCQGNNDKIIGHPYHEIQRVSPLFRASRASINLRRSEVPVNKFIISSNVDSFSETDR